MSRVQQGMQQWLETRTLFPVARNDRFFLLVNQATFSREAHVCSSHLVVRETTNNNFGCAICGFSGSSPPVGSLLVVFSKAIDPQIRHIQTLSGQFDFFLLEQVASFCLS